MKYEIPVTLSNNKKINVTIDKPELIYGATAIVMNSNEENLYAINPVTNDKLDIILRNEEPRFFIPMHIEEDYQYAIKNHLRLKQVVFPYFYGNGDRKPREDIITQRRHSVIAVIKHNKKDEYLCEDAKGRECKSFVLGGIEDGETPEEAAIREVYEETGYKNIKITNVSNISLINHFYAEYKGVNRFARLEIVFGELINDEQDEITDEEKHKHTVLWISKDNLKSFLNLEHNHLALNILLNGECAWVNDGIVLTNDENNELLSKEVRGNIIKKYCA